MAGALQVLGAALQIAGVIVLGIGITRTRRVFFPESKGWWQELAEWLSRRWSRFWRWITRRGGENQSVAVGAALESNSALSAHAIKRYGPLPEDEAARWRLVEDRLAELLDKAQTVERRADDHDEEIAKLRSEIEAAVRSLEEYAEQQVKQLAESGLRLESWSVGLISCGLFLSTVGLIVS